MGESASELGLEGSEGLHLREMSRGVHSREKCQQRLKDLRGWEEDRAAPGREGRGGRRWRTSTLAMMEST